MHLHLHSVDYMKLPGYIITIGGCVSPAQKPCVWLRHILRNVVFE